MDRDDERRALTRRELLRVAAVGAAASLVGCGDDDGTRDGSVGPADGSLDATRDAASLDDAAMRDDAATGDGGGGVDGGREEPPGELPETVTESAEHGLGVASGDVRPDGAVLWTRYDGASALRLRVWRMDGDEYAALVHDAEVTPADGGFVHVDVGLPVAGARYRYAFFSGEGEARRRSPIGRFRAALDESTVAPLVLGAMSCTKNGRNFAAIERAGERDDLDAFLLLGDTTYADGAVSLADYRGMWAENFETPAYRALRAATSVYATWDDHEVDNNWDPETIDPAQHRAALDAFFEHTPARRLDGAPDRIWRSARWGRTLELFVLDCRSERLASTRRGDDATYVSRAQLDWLKAGLASSTATFKVVMNTVPISEYPIVNLGWEGYAAQREELLRFIDEMRIPGLLWVSGDFHLACLSHVGRDSGSLGWNQWEILAGPGAQLGNPLAGSLSGPQFVFASRTNNYTELAFDPTSGEITIRWIDGDGTAFETHTLRP